MSTVHSEGLLLPRPDDLQLFMRIEIGRTTTGARTAVSTGRVVDEAFAMAVDVEPASSGGSGLDRKRFLLRRSGASVIKTLASQTRPDDDSGGIDRDDDSLAAASSCSSRALSYGVLLIG